MSRWSFVLAALMPGCSRFAPYDWADLSDVDAVTKLELRVRPETLHTSLFLFPPDVCVTDTRANWTIAEGGCDIDTDEDGEWDEQWSGHVERKTVGDKTSISYRDLSVRYPVACAGTGDYFTILIEEGLATDWVDGSFDVEVGGLVHFRCSTATDGATGFDYTFDVRYHGETPNHDNGQVWQGDGKYADSEVGMVEVDTVDFHGPQFEAACDVEPETGTTSLSTPEHDAVLQFDGATACEGSVPWTLDGQDQPPLVPLL